MKFQLAKEEVVEPPKEEEEEVVEPEKPEVEEPKEEEPPVVEPPVVEPEEVQLKLDLSGASVLTSGEATLGDFTVALDANGKIIYAKDVKIDGINRGNAK